MGVGHHGTDPGGTMWYCSGSHFSDFHRFSVIFIDFLVIFDYFHRFSGHFRPFSDQFGPFSGQFGQKTVRACRRRRELGTGGGYSGGDGGGDSGVMNSGVINSLFRVQTKQSF